MAISSDAGSIPAASTIQEMVPGQVKTHQYTKINLIKAGEKRARNRILIISLSLGVTMLIAAVSVYFFLR